MAYSFKAMYETQTSNSYRILSETFNTLGVNPEIHTCVHPVSGVNTLKIKI